VNKASALALAATTTAVIEAAEKEVAVKKVGWLKSSTPNARHEEGRYHWPAPALSSCGPLPPLGTS
jgi:hypothetical protein